MTDEEFVAEIRRRLAEDNDTAELKKAVEEFAAKIARTPRKSRKKKRKIVTVELPDQGEETP